MIDAQEKAFDEIMARAKKLKWDHLMIMEGGDDDPVPGMVIGDEVYVRLIGEAIEALEANEGTGFKELYERERDATT